MAKTFGTLKTALTDHLNRSDIVDAVQGDFINSAMRILENGQFGLNGRMISHNFNAQNKRQTTTGTITAGVPDTYLVFPTMIKDVEWLKLYRADDSRWYDLELRSAANALSQYPFDSSVQDQPVMAALIQAQSQILLRPNPDQAYSYDCSFYQFTPEMSSTNDHNNWTDYHWEILLYGALTLAEPYLVGDPRIEVWKGLYQTAVASLVRQEISERISGGMLTIASYLPRQLAGNQRFNINEII